jgi:hypothetical protein
MTINGVLSRLRRLDRAKCERASSLRKARSRPTSSCSASLIERQLYDCFERAPGLRRSAGPRSAKWQTPRMETDADENDSPFAHVPMPGAGPSPLQEGPLTYEKLVASSGRGSLRGLSRSRVVALWIVIVIVIGSILALLVASLVR